MLNFWMNTCQQAYQGSKITVKVKVKSLSCVRLFATPWTVVYQAPPSMGFSRQEYWNGLPFPSPGDIPNPGMPVELFTGWQTTCWTVFVTCGFFWTMHGGVPNSITTLASGPHFLKPAPKQWLGTAGILRHRTPLWMVNHLESPRKASTNIP